MIKSVREAKVYSTWDTPNIAYEEALLDFVDQSLDPERSRAFLAAFLPFQERVARLGVRNSLVQTALKLTLPGVPDIYQGAELWDLSLTDPDNRRPVDYEVRARLLEELEKPHKRDRLPALLEHWHDGSIKLAVIARILACRRDRPELFDAGEYEALALAGEKAEHVCAFARRHEAHTLLVVAARFPAALDATPGWHDTTIPLPDGLSTVHWCDLLNRRQNAFSRRSTAGRTRAAAVACRGSDFDSSSR